MSTQAQINANRANAQKSTGPRTPQGKVTASKNALIHGFHSADIILPHEDPAEYQQMADSFLESYPPADPIEAILLQRIVSASWRLLRAQRYETAVLSRPHPQSHEDPLAKVKQSFFNGLYDKIIRYESTQERHFHRALTALHRHHRDQQRQENRKTNPISLPRAPRALRG